MTIVKAVLVTRVVPGWPDEVIRDTVPLGREYRVDLDSERIATLCNLAHPGWGSMDVQAVLDIDAGFPLPVCCLRFAES